MNRVVVSRKGFDSSFGSVPSPIFPDGTMASIPIPDPASPVRYRDIASPCGRSMGDVLQELSRGRFSHEQRAHLDPDLAARSTRRPTGWKPVFGQCSGAQTHLYDHGVGEGDLFLFFGWFREVEDGPSGLRYRRGAPDLHVLFGWLRVGTVLKPASGAVPEWAHSHPHLHGSRPANNTLYVAAPRGDGAPDAGVFTRFDDALVLTDRRCRTRSSWRLPAAFAPGCMSHHINLRRWTSEADAVLVKSVGRGQEFVVDVERHEAVGTWADALVRRAA